jgi:hypothetical protein
MDPARWITVIALTFFLAEGFTLSVFPRQFQELMQEVDPRTLQIAGLVETVMAVGLMAGILLLD